jgi:bromodomain-containing protein 7/9
MSLSEHIHSMVDELTEGQHSLLRETAEQLYIQSRDSSAQPDAESPLAMQTATSLHLAPKASIALRALLQIKLQKIDMSALINLPEELFLSEEEWAGKGLKEKRKVMQEKADVLARKRARIAPEDDDAMEVEEDSVTEVDANGVSQPTTNEAANAAVLEVEGPEELAEVLDYVADLIVELNRCASDAANTSSMREDTCVKPDPATIAMATGASGTATITGEDSTLRNLRLNLLALAKRAPLDTIARLPLELVPEHIRHYIPTLDKSTSVPTPSPSTGVTTPLYTVAPSVVTPATPSSTPTPSS